MNNKEMVRRLIEDEGMSVLETSYTLMISTQRIYAILDELGLETPTRRRKRHIEDRLRAVSVSQHSGPSTEDSENPI